MKDASQARVFLFQKGIKIYQRAKKHLFVIGDSKDWSEGVLSSELQSDEMVVYASLSDFYQAKTTPKSQVLANGGIIFNFGANS